MSTLWTPGGEVPIGSDSTPSRSPDDSDSGGGTATASAETEVDLDNLSPEEREKAEEMIREMAEVRERLLAAPAAVVVANHGLGLYELAALHLAQQPPNFSEAVVAIDALGAMTDTLKGRLGDPEKTLQDALDQIRKAYVTLKNRPAEETDDDAEPENAETGSKI